jgi:hypothetical protein
LEAAENIIDCKAVNVSEHFKRIIIYKGLFKSAWKQPPECEQMKYQILEFKKMLSMAFKSFVINFSHFDSAREIEIPSFCMVNLSIDPLGDGRFFDEGEQKRFRRYVTRETVDSKTDFGLKYLDSFDDELKAGMCGPELKERNLIFKCMKPIVKKMLKKNELDFRNVKAMQRFLRGDEMSIFNLIFGHQNFKNPGEILYMPGKKTMKDFFR